MGKLGGYKLSLFCMFNNWPFASKLSQMPVESSSSHYPDSREICPLSKVKSQMGRWVKCLSVTATYLPARCLVSILLVMSVKVWRSTRENGYGMRSLLTTSVTSEVRLRPDVEIPWTLMILRITTRCSTRKSPISSTKLWSV